MKKPIIQAILVTLFFSLNCLSQFSKTHYIPPVAASSSVPAGPQYIYISTPSTTPVNFTLTEIGGTVINGTVARDTPYVLDITSSTQFVEDTNDVSNVKSDKGYIVEASDMVYVTIRVIDQTGNQSELIP